MGKRSDLTRMGSIDRLYLGDHPGMNAGSSCLGGQLRPVIHGRHSPGPGTYDPPPQGIHSTSIGSAGSYRHGPGFSMTQRRTLRGQTGVSTDVIEAEPGPSTYLAKSTYWDGRSTLGKSMSGSALLRGRR